MMFPAEAQAEDGAPIADVIEAGPLVRDMDRVVHRQYDDRRTEPDRRRDRGGIGQHHHRVETEDVVESVFGYPQIAEPERFGALRDPSHHCHVDWLGRAVRQRHAQRNLVFQGHAARLYAGLTFSINSIWAPSGASRKQTRRPLFGGNSSRTRTPLSRSLAIAPG
jgi:hypothetical protein